MTEQEEEEGKMPYDDHVPLNEGAVGKTEFVWRFTKVGVPPPFSDVW